MEPIITILCTAIGSSGLSAIIVALLNRHWTKKDRKDDELDHIKLQLNAVAESEKVNMIDRIRWLGKEYIKDGKISLEDKENLQSMYSAYKALGGNGHLVTVMDEVNHLPIDTGGDK